MGLVKCVILMICASFGGSISTLAQAHLEPVDGADGIPGPVSNSFYFSWAIVDSAEGYEYILSNNSQCFAGCAGDTRQAFTGETPSALEYNLIEGISYYWITRIIYKNGSKSSWSSITSFRAITPPYINPTELVRLGPNPSSNKLQIEIDWDFRPEAKELNFDLYTINGVKISSNVITKQSQNIRIQTYEYPTSHLKEGIYIAWYVSDAFDQAQVIKRILITR